MQADVLVAGNPARAASFALSAPISFWGGVDAATGVIIDARHPERGESISDRVLLLPSTIGSSSAAAVLLELVHRRRAPAAIVLHEPDAILLLGLIVAREMGYETPIAIRLDRDRFTELSGQIVDISIDGVVTCHRPETRSSR